MILRSFAALLLLAGPSVTPVPMPNGRQGIGFDDLGYSQTLERILVPAGRTGSVDLVDPKTLSIESIGGFTSSGNYRGGHGEGTTSADVGASLLFASDRDAKQVRAVDAKTHQLVSTVSLQGSPDYVRWVEPLHEVWVTEPGHKQIEFFKLDHRQLVRSGRLAVPDGPESLIIDPTRARAYTHAWHGQSYAIDLNRHTLVATWRNGCKGSRGVALDEKHGWLFVGCDEGKAVTLDVTSGRPLGEARTGAGVDIIAYAPALHHLYVPGGDSATLTILGVGENGSLAPLTTIPVAKDSHCVATDGAGDVFVCDPHAGRLLLVHDAPPTK